MKAIKKIILYILLLTVLIGVIFNNQVNAENSKDQLVVIEGVEENVDLLSAIDTTNPIRRNVLDSSPNYFCYEHGTAFADKKDNKLGIHKTWDLDNFAYVRYSNDWIIRPKDGTNATYPAEGSSDYDYKNNGEEPTDTTYSNFKYITSTETYSKGFAFILAKYKQTPEERAASSYDNDPLQHAIWDRNGKLQSGETNELEAAEDAFDRYYDDVTKNPNVSCEALENVGTTIDGENYKVGPFTMSGYKRAVDYKFNDPYREDTNLQAVFGTAANMQGTVISAKAILDNGTEINFDVPEPNKTFYINIPKTSIGNATKLDKIVFTYQIISASGNGTIYTGYQVKITWKEDDSWSGCLTYSCTECSNNEVPYQNRSQAGKTHDYWCGGSGYCKNGSKASVFYINSDIPDGCSTSWNCGKTSHKHDATCKSLTCKKETHTHSDSCRTLTCTLHTHTGKSGSCYSYCSKTAHKHGNGCDYSSCTKWFLHSHSAQCCNKDEHTHSITCRTLTCNQHTHSGKSGSCYSYCSKEAHAHSEANNCYGITCGETAHEHHISVCGKKHNCTIGGHCSHKKENGIHKGEACNGTTKCTHKHTNCQAFRWKIASINQDNCQDALEAYGELKSSTTDYTVDVDIPLVTNVSIYKYISKVEHKDGTVIFESDDRKNKTDKLTDTVKVERGDKVTFKIEIVNSSDFDVKVKVADTLPSSVEYSNVPSAIGASTRIKVGANSTKTFKVVLKPDATSGSYTNTVAIITTNDGNAKVETADGKEIVNTSTKLNDADSYTIKEYDVGINKRIVEVKHTANNTVIYSGNDRAEKDETYKKDNPLGLEYGDTVKYEIELSNTTQNRSDSPYWNPDKVYVDVEDTLPLKYTNLKVKVAGRNKNVTVSNGKLTLSDVEVPVGGTTKIEVSLIVDEHDKTKIEVNTAKIVGNILNVNAYEIKNNSSNTQSSDYYKLSDYNVSINKYISEYQNSEAINNNNKFFTTEEDDSLGDRYAMSEQEKSEKAVQVEKNETVIYSIRVNNDSEGTSVKPTLLKETLQTGLEFKSIYAKVFEKDGKSSGNIDVTATHIGNNTYELTVPKDTILDPGEYIIYYVTVNVTESNMYLGRLANTAVITKLTNVNDKEIQNDEGINENISTKQNSSDYVQMKDLIIAGKVWFDENKDGLMNSEQTLEGIIVKLYSVGTGANGTDTLVRTTKTDSSGLYTFAKKEDGTWYNGTYSYTNGLVKSEQRIPKANGNTYIQYYIEFEYDGLVYKSTEAYAGKTNLNNDGTIKNQNYYIDSNAAELNTAREAFNEKYEIIGFNKAYDGKMENSVNLEYEKNGHISTLKPGSERLVKSRSFITENKQNTDYLWLYKQASDYKLPETEYLKYINLGLALRDEVDLSITQDVYEVKTTINGDEMSYEYNQNDFTLGNANIDKAQDGGADNKFKSERYMTGYKNDESTLSTYEFKAYNSDYNYKVSDYSIDTVKDYKGPESELNVETTFRIRVTNNGGDRIDKNAYVGINEIVEYYDSDFVDLELNADGTVKTINVKTKDENGYLVNTPLKVVNAEYVMKDGSRKEATLSTTSIYNETRNLNNYSTLYIRPKVNAGQLPLAGDIIIGQEEAVDILITFIVDKNNSGILLEDKINIAEISAYSTYYKNESGVYYPAGLVDVDSNPGNLENANNVGLYEDDTFKTGIKVSLQASEKERVLTGFVWDDAKTETVEDANEVQYIGDGIYDTSKKAIEKPKKNQAVSNKEEKDIAVKDVKVQLVELVSMPGRTYEETIQVNDEKSLIEVRTNNEGKYAIKGYIPGNYIVKFIYGDDKTKENMLIFNGQDYKSTTYQATEGIYAENKTNPDEVLSALEKANLSDAKDDEIRRLETISYSETMTNNLNEILRGKASSNPSALVENTKMHAETAEFAVKTEKETIGKTKLTYAETMNKFSSTERHPIKNIDFGITYRPELQISLNKYIAGVTITTSAQNSESASKALVDAKFKEYYGIVVKTDITSGATEFLTGANGEIVRVDRNATKQDIKKAANEAEADLTKCETADDGKYIVTLAGTELDSKTSVGLENLQYVENIFERDLAGNLFLYDTNGYVKARQGFIYLNIDDEIMQGASISIKYVFAANNLSEIDRISSNLSSLRFKENDAVQAYKVEGQYYDQVKIQSGTNTGYIDVVYSAAGTARNKLFSEYYAYELNGNEIKKDAEGNPIIYRIKDKNISTDDTYYGRYLGSVYYTGKIGNKDVVAELKIDKILDYIDNDLVFDNSQNNGENSLWKTTTSQELLASGLINRDAFKDGKLLDSDKRAYDTAERSNLAILLDDRIKDYTNPSEDKTVNKDISKFLTPRYSNGANSFGTVNLVASKVIAAEDKSEDMTYENVGEIIQYTSVTGRVTSLGTTLGNANLLNKTEWDEGRRESDTAATEKVTLTPPTGLGMVEQIVRDTVEGASYMVVIIIAGILVCVAVLGSIKLYRNRRIK